MTVVAVAPTLFVAASIAAAIDDGLIPRPRVLMTVNASAVPEVTMGVGDLANFAALAARFDAVVDLNDVIAPQHPRGLRADSPAARAARLAIADAAGGDVARIVASFRHSAPSGVLAALFPEARVDVVADGISESGAMALGVRPETLGRVLAELAGAPQPAEANEAWLLGESPRAAASFTVRQQEELYAGWVDAAADAGYAAVAFKPHPSAAPLRASALAARAAARGIAFRLLPGDEPAALALARTRPLAVIGSSSPTLALASAVYGIAAITPDAGGGAVAVEDAAGRATAPRDSRLWRLVGSARNVIDAVWFSVRN